MEDCDVEQILNKLQQILQKMTGLHRQLWDTVRAERDALVLADNKALHDAVLAKEALIEAIRQQEYERVQQLEVLSIAWNRRPQDLTLSEIAIQLQGRDPKRAEQLRSTYNALTILIERVTEQNADNGVLAARSLEHIENMKKNVLGEGAPHSGTYTQEGQRAGASSGARLISKEA
jgi:flagellar biosynthesis/type III secretory pathway chaperone